MQERAQGLFCRWVWQKELALSAPYVTKNCVRTHQSFQPDQVSCSGVDVLKILNVGQLEVRGAVASVCLVFCFFARSVLHDDALV